MVGIQTTNGWVVVLVLTSRLCFPSLVARMVKNLSAMQETQVLGGEDPLEKEMATHSSILARRVPWIEESGGLSPGDCKESDMTEWLTLAIDFA